MSLNSLPSDLQSTIEEIYDGHSCDHADKPRACRCALRANSNDSMGSAKSRKKVWFAPRPEVSECPWVDRSPIIPEPHRCEPQEPDNRSTFRRKLTKWTHSFVVTAYHSNGNGLVALWVSRLVHSDWVEAFPSSIIFLDLQPFFDFSKGRWRPNYIDYFKYPQTLTRQNSSIMNWIILFFDGTMVIEASLCEID